VSDPEIAPKAAVRFRSPNPSGRGVGVMESLGTEQVYLGLGGINRRDFYGQVNSIMPNLEFLGYNVHPHPWA